MLRIRRRDIVTRLRGVRRVRTDRLAVLGLRRVRLTRRLRGAERMLSNGVEYSQVGPEIGMDRWA